jgi:hypothetical protein
VATRAMSHDTWKAPEGLPIAFPVCQYLWKSHLDATFLDGGRALIPSPWLAQRLGLSPDAKDASICRTPKGKMAFVGSRLGAEGSSGRIKAALLNPMLEAENLECLWLFVGERSAWPGGENDHTARRRSEGLWWLEGNLANATMQMAALWRLRKGPLKGVTRRWQPSPQG